MNNIAYLGKQGQFINHGRKYRSHQVIFVGDFLVFLGQKSVKVVKFSDRKDHNKLGFRCELHMFNLEVKFVVGHGLKYI